jgi:hypothetical protein
MQSELVSKSWLYRSIDVFTPDDTIRVEYDGIGLNGGEFSYECVLVNGVVAARSRGWLSLVSRFTFDLGSLPAVLEVHTWPWLTLKTLRLSVDSELVYDDATQSSTRPFPFSRKSAACKLAGIGLTLLGLVCVGIGRRTITSGQGLAYALATAVVGALLVPFGVSIFNYGRRINPVIAAETVTRGRRTVSRDHRSPVLYLRAFKEDSSQPVIPVPSPHIPMTSATEEEQLARVLTEIGPVIAIGRPGEELPHLGAVRRYLADDEWRAEVCALMLKARLVVLRAGTGSESFWWEVERAAQLVRPERLVLLVPVDEREFETFRHQSQKLLPRQLPPCTSKKPLLWDLSLKGLCYFAPDWTPHYMSLRGLPLVGRGDLLMPYRPAFKIALRPVFAQLGVEWEAPPSQWTAIVVLLAVSIVVIVGIIGFVVWSS